MRMALAYPTWLAYDLFYRQFVACVWTCVWTRYWLQLQEKEVSEAFWCSTRLLVDPAIQEVGFTPLLHVPD